MKYFQFQGLSTLYQPTTKEEKWQTTNEIYADFDCYLHTKSKPVPFAAIMTGHIIEYSPQQETMKRGNKRSYDETLKESFLPNRERGNTTQSSGAIVRKNNEKNGVTSSEAKDRKKVKLPQPKRIKIEGNQKMTIEQHFERPTESFPCLIKMAMRDSGNGWLLVEEIHKYICDHFPYYRTAKSTWKNSVRHSLSAGDRFLKQELPDGSKQTRFIWSLNPKHLEKRKSRTK
ncbi:MAG TPA: hypothetical protein VGC17_01965 [Lactovum miscens]|uniref:hypothetical protein n=1 Tax=Lactovum miscens TaxID=190387 RepID=UPI002ED89C61